MLAAAVADDLDQIEVAQQVALQQDRARHFDLVVGQHHHELARRVAGLGEAFAQLTPDRQLDLGEQLFQDLRDQVFFLFGQDLFVAGAKVADFRGQALTSRDRPIEGQFQEEIQVFASGRHAAFNQAPLVTTPTPPTLRPDHPLGPIVRPAKRRRGRLQFRQFHALSILCRPFNRRTGNGSRPRESKAHAPLTFD